MLFILLCCYYIVTEKKRRVKKHGVLFLEIKPEIYAIGV